MADVFVRNQRPSPRGRRRDLGEIPLSTGEIEYLSRQDEAARRRQRLLHVREQEKRAAQLVTQRYRENLKKLQGYRLKYAQQEQAHKQELLLSALHEKYQLSLQGMGTAQRNAREKVAELVELAQNEKDKWAFNRHGEKQRFDDAVDAVHENQAERLARRREIERNLLRLKEMSVRQRGEASARAKRELELQLQLQRAQEEAQRFHQQQAECEEFSYPRKTEKDVTAYHITRTHCVTLPTHGGIEVNKSTATTDGYKEVKVVRHNRVKRTVASAFDQAEAYRLEMERMREEQRQLREENTRVAVSRGEEALHVVDSTREGERAFIWLVSMDQQERAGATLHPETDKIRAIARLQENSDFQGDGDGSEAFARRFGIDDTRTSDLLGVSGTDDEQPERLQRMAARRADSIDGSDDSSLLDRQYREERREREEEWNRDGQLPPTSERAIERKLEAMDDLLKRVASYGKKDGMKADDPRDESAIGKPDETVRTQEEGKQGRSRRSQSPSHSSHSHSSKEKRANESPGSDGEFISHLSKRYHDMSADSPASSFASETRSGSDRRQQQQTNLLQAASDGEFISELSNRHQDVSAAGSPDSSFASEHRSGSDLHQQQQNNSLQAASDGEFISQLSNRHQDVSAAGSPDSSFASEHRSGLDFLQQQQTDPLQAASTSPARQRAHDGADSRFLQYISNDVKTDRLPASHDQQQKRSGTTSNELNVDPLGSSSTSVPQQKDDTKVDDASVESTTRKPNDAMSAVAEKSSSRCPSKEALSFPRRLSSTRLRSRDCFFAGGDHSRPSHDDSGSPHDVAEDSDSSPNDTMSDLNGVFEPPYPSSIRRNESIRAEGSEYLRQMQRDGNTLGSNSSSLHQYSLPLSDSFSSINDSHHGRDSIRTLTNQLVPIFPHHHHPSNESAGGDNNNRTWASTATPQGETSILLPGLAPQESQSERHHSQQHSSGRNAPVSPRQDSQILRTAPEETASDDGNASLRGVKVNAGQARQNRSEASDMDDQQRIQDRSFSSDSSSDVSEYMYLEKMRKMTGFSTISTRASQRHDQSLRSSSIGSTGNVGGAVSAVMQAATPTRFNNNHPGRRDSSVSSSSSTPSVDARFQYLVHMTAVAGKALPLHLNLSSDYAQRRDIGLPPPQIRLGAYSSDSESEISAGKSDPQSSRVEEVDDEEERSVTSPLKEGPNAGSRERASQMPRNPFGAGAVNFTIPPSTMFRSLSASIQSNQSSASSNSEQKVAHRNQSFPQFDLEDLEQRLASLPPPPFGDLDMSQPPAPLAWINSDDRDQSIENSALPVDGACTPTEFTPPVRRDVEQDTPAATPRKRGDALFVPFDNQRSTSPATSPEGASLADAFRARHPSFHYRAQSTKGLLEHRRRQLEQRRAGESQDDDLAQSRDSEHARPQPTAPPSSVRPPLARSYSSPSRPGRPTQSAALSMPKPELLDRLAAGQRAKISADEMRERTRRLYNKLPEVAERKRQEDVLERRRERLAELREREKSRRQQQRQRQNQVL